MSTNYWAIIAGEKKTAFLTGYQLLPV